MNVDNPLHIKYRPKTFDEVVGNDSAIQSLKTMLDRETGKQHAILFTGPSGCGKTTLARIVKDKLGCIDVDFIELNAANFRGIDTVRWVSEMSQFMSIFGGVRIYLFDEFHQVTKDAQNALLKLLEDTPEYIYFILATTDPEKVIKTIRNRCAIFEVKPLNVRDMMGLLGRVLEKEKVELSTEAINEIVKVAEGSPRKALVVLDKVIDIENDNDLLKAIKDLQVDESQIIDLCRALIKRDESEVRGLLKELKDDPEKIRYAIAGYFTTVLLSKSWKTDEAARINAVLSCFVESFMYGGKGMLVNSCYLALVLKS